MPSQSQQPTETKYKNSNLPIEERIADLLSQMTLDEKLAQMVGIWTGKNETLLNEAGNFDLEKAKLHYEHGNGLGQIGRPGDTGEGKNAREMAEVTNAMQRFFVENSRLGIPVFFHDECLHGLAANDSTSFSQPIGLGATFNPELVQRLFSMVALEAALRGVHQALSPVLDVARDPRWGRVEETFGEDPFLVATLGVAAIKGFQGDASFQNRESVVATLKHFAAHGQPESGINCAPVNVSERVLREVFLYPFRKAVQEGGALSVMASYNEIDSVPSHANAWLLRRILREEWGFKGTVVSDYYGIRELEERPDLYGHHVAADAKEAAVLAARAGVNIELPEADCYNHLAEAVRDGSISESVIDELVGKLLHQKFLLGLFEQPYVDPDRAERIVGCEDHTKLALEAARQTITLLKNRNGVAPLNQKRIKTIAVIGPNAHRELLGGYSAKPKKVQTVLEGIKEFLGDNVEVLHHHGCHITIGGGWWEDEVITSNPAEDRASIAEATALAQKADAVILAVGGNEQTSREAWSTTHMGDRTNLQMVGLQDELVDALAETGKPLIALLFNGRPLSTVNLAEKADALFECWYMGQETARAVAETIFGENNPGGKLPISIPRSVGHIPSYYNHKPSAKRGYLFDTVEPLFPFGYGLSYTQFSFSKPKLKSETIRVGESTEVSIDITNTGRMDGEEVVQLYIRDCVSSVTRPVKELKGFQRIHLKAGETRTVVLCIEPEQLSFYNINMEYLVEPGEFTIMLGNSSRNENLHELTLTVVG